MKNKPRMKGPSGKPTTWVGGVQVGQAVRPKASPTTTKATIRTALTATSVFCVRRDSVRPEACRTVSTITIPAPNNRWLMPGTSVAAKAPAATASMAIGAENPKSSDAQPAR